MIKMSRNQEERAQRLHKEAIIVDTHCDSIGEYLSKWRTPGRNFGVKGETGQVDLPRLIEGGVTCQVFAISALRDRAARGPIVPEVLLKGLIQIDKFYYNMANNAGFKTVTTVDEIRGDQGSLYAHFVSSNRKVRIKTIKNQIIKLACARQNLRYLY